MKYFLQLCRKVLTHQSVLAQLVSTVSAVLVVVILSRLLSNEDYADYAVVTAIWSIGNAVAGSGIGTRIARMSAAGCKQITFKISELVLMLSVSTIAGLYVAWLRTSYVEGLLAALCMLTFPLAEASISFEVGAERFQRYLFLLSLRVVVPIVILALAALTGPIQLIHAFISVAIGNICCLMPWFRRWSAERYVGPSYASHFVGAINLGLWIIASADRIVLGNQVPPSQLAVYALTYGLLDRFYRALSNAFITRSLGPSYNGRRVVPHWKYYVASLLIFATCIPATKWGTELVSDGRYSPDFLLVALISGAGLLMFWSAPHYVSLLATGRYKASLLVVSFIACANVCGNLALGEAFGVIAAASISLSSYFAWFLWLLCSVGAGSAQGSRKDA